MKVKTKGSSILERVMGKRDEKALNRTRARMLVAAKIAEAAQNKGLTQKKLAALVNKTESEVSEYLSGERNMTIDAIADFEYALGITILNVARTRVFNLKITEESAQVSSRRKYTLTSSNFIKYDDSISIEYKPTSLSLAQ